MKELDFDELDQAVNSLMNKASHQASRQSDGNHQVVERNANEEQELGADNSGNIYTEPEPSSSPTAQSNDASQSASADQQRPDYSAPSIAIRRGKAMDIIKPAARDSDRRSPILFRSNSRQGVTVHPNENTPVVDNQTTDALNEEPTIQNSIDNSTVDPQNVETMPVPEPVQPAVDMQPNGESASSEAEQPADQESLNSPFLADAKVEKRPLGRPNIPTNFNRSPISGGLRGDAIKTSGTTLSEVDAQLPEQPLPAEFSKEILEVETNSVGVDRPSSGTSSPVPVRTTANSQPVSSDKYQATQAPAKDNQPPVGSIYDTAAYHQPLSHPAKSKPSWLIIVAIVVVVLLGIASGVALYNLGII